MCIRDSLYIHFWLGRSKLSEAPLEHTTPFCKPDYFIMSKTFAEFLLDNASTGNEILSVLDDIVEVTETGGTDL